MKNPLISMKLYILMRSDLPSLNPGKAMAQSAHAANHFVYRYGILDIFKQWATKTRPFGTTIVVAVTGKELIDILDDAHKRNVPCGAVWDETYPFIVNTEIATLVPQDKQTAPAIYKKDGQVIMFRNELTCGYVFVEDESSSQKDLVGALPLYP